MGVEEPYRGMKGELARAEINWEGGGGVVRMGEDGMCVDLSAKEDDGEDEESRRGAARQLPLPNPQKEI